MKNVLLIPLALITAISLSACEAVNTVFKAGMWWGILLVVGIIVLIIWLLGRGRNR